MLKRRVFVGFMAVLLGGFLYTAAEGCPACKVFSFTGNVASAAAEEGQEGRFPYGGSRQGEYGQKKAVSTAAEARRTLNEYFSKKDVSVGAIREREFYFEADIMDRKGRIVDRVIVNKRTGRIRSIY
ncbi:MAG: hypothetical protein M1497_13425 [Nitrospirae bacterium]|nr:hypothetical protein [Nitrospirota bacterium]